MRKGHLKVVVLKLLSEESLSGYDIIKKIEERTGCWKPSPGSIYPLLNSMLKDGLVRVRRVGRRKVYTIMQEGRNKLKLIRERFDEIIRSVIDGLAIFESFGDRREAQEAKILIQLLTQIKEGKLSLYIINSEITDLRREMLRLITSKLLERKGRAIKNVLRKAVNELKRIR